MSRVAPEVLIHLQAEFEVPEFLQSSETVAKVTAFYFICIIIVVVVVVVYCVYV